MQGIGVSLPGTGYGYKSGTSMAAPHVAGAVALLWSAQPALRNQIDQTEYTLNTTAWPRYSTQCGDPPNTVPNNVYGWGRLDVLAAVQQALGPNVGHIEGAVVTVVDGSSVVPVQGATVRAITSTTVYTTVTAATGYYTMTLSPYTYTVSAWRYGYARQTVTDVVVPRAVVTTLPFTLTQTLPHALTGCITDSVTGDPLWATVSVLGPFGDLVAQTTVPQATGCYTLTLYGGPYTVTAQARLHQPGAAFVDLVADTVQSFALDPTTGVDLGATTASQTGPPGQPVTHTLWVTNTDNVTDTFDFTHAGNTWTVRLPVTRTMLAAGASEDVIVRVSVPVDAMGGVVDTVTVTAISQGDGTRFESITLTTTADNVYSVTLESLTAMVSGNPGEAVTRTLWVSNAGNTGDTFVLVISGNVWTTTVSVVTGTAMLPAVGPLGVDEGVILAVKVDIPFSARSGYSDTTVITVTSQSDGTVFASTLLTTMVVSRYEVYLPLVLRE